MYKVYLAVGNESVENYIKSQKPLLEKMLKDTVNFIGVTVYKEGALQGVKDYHPDVMILREGLQGTMDILDLIYKVRLESSNTRIILITKTRSIGDAFLATAVQLGVYDLIVGDKISVKDLLKKIVYPTRFVDVAHLIPRMTINEKTQKSIFSAPDVDALVKQRVEEIMTEQNAQQIAEEPMPTKQSDTSIQKPIDTPKPVVNIAKPIENTSHEPVTQPIVEPVEESVVEPVVEDATSKKTDVSMFMDTVKKTLAEHKPDEDVPYEKINLLEDNSVAAQMYQEDEDEEEVFEIPVKHESDDAPITEPLKREDVPADLYEPVQPNQNPYTSQQYIPPENNKQTTSKKKGFSLFKNNKKTQKTISSQIITFWGGGNGVGNSQIAFNTAIALANHGYHVIYIDLNDNFSSVESMMQLGFEDLGVDTMLQSISMKNNAKVGMGISSIAKILPFTDKRDYLYKTYTNMPNSLNFAFFSQNRFNRRGSTDYDIEFLKELNMMLLMDFGYDVIILDAPADTTNRATQLALAYSNKVFVTLNQDKTVLNRMLRQMKYLSLNRINIRDKCYFIVNKFESNNFSYNNLSNFIAMNLQYENLELLSIPNMSKEFINSIYNGLPVILSTKNKEFIKTVNDIITLIES